MALRTTILASALLPAAVHSLNPLFVNPGYPECGACLDQAYQACPGDYETKPYAECMCGGDGGAVFTNCMPLCNTELILGSEILVPAFYNYCINFFEEYCQSAFDAGVPENIWENSVCVDGGSSSGSGSDSEIDSESSSGAGAGPGSASESGSGSASESSSSPSSRTGSSSSASESESSGSDSGKGGSDKSAAACLIPAGVWGSSVLALGMAIV
ncbi:hypothetical protein jhhlp_008533 [Lomentospora prolificans]|uniref:Extracellular membrane protein CFEM domain-containing protein n=1 Tax=Lomentospora prolificans TaxID=41688 RepID=A0A2N3MYB6_9PEZI|nr:hypothetical protein jhhlp_008533 [Lomentospora prolificans]